MAENSGHEIFTHILFDHYSSPKHFGFDILDKPHYLWVNDGLSPVFNA